VGALYPESPNAESKEGHSELRGRSFRAHRGYREDSICRESVAQVRRLLIPILYGFVDCGICVDTAVFATLPIHPFSNKSGTFEIVCYH
jgi:hypothetical protein